ncbi:MAG TPA: hypothetical protein VMZ28_00325 [Kofleriaceae bacterium]|nr:hypothetical protein [Kofleriaceae bacterium]
MHRAVTLSLSLCLIAVATATATAGGQRRPASAARLVKLGYSPEVADRVARRDPALARRILRAKASDGPLARETPRPMRSYRTADGRPLRLYRGVAHDLAHYDLSFRHTRIPGMLFFSEQITEPHRYAWGDALDQRAVALAAGEIHGTVIELEVPGFLTWSYGHPVLLADEVPDLSLFVHRVARVDLTRPYFPALRAEELTWEAPDALLAAAGRAP